MTAKDLRVGDVVSKPSGFMDWPKWEHKVTRVTNDVIFCVFDNGLPDSKSRHANSVIGNKDWMSIANMQSCLNQPDTVVHRPQPDGSMKQIYPEVEG